MLSQCLPDCMYQVNFYSWHQKVLEQSMTVMFSLLSIIVATIQCGCHVNEASHRYHLGFHHLHNMISSWAPKSGQWAFNAYWYPAVKPFANWHDAKDSACYKEIGVGYINRQYAFVLHHTKHVAILESKHCFGRVVVHVNNEPLVNGSSYWISQHVDMYNQFYG